MPSRSIIRTGVGPHRAPGNRFPAMAAAINLLAARAARVQSRRNLSRSLSPKLDHSHSITRFDRSRTGPYTRSTGHFMVNRAGFSEAFWRGSRGSGHLHLIVIARLGFGRRQVADGLEQPAVVEPVHPLKRGELHRLKGPPRPASVDHLGLVEAVDRLRERIIKTVADAADRGLDARRSQALGIAN